MEQRETVLITGASTGIGFELAKIFFEKGYDLVLISQNKDRLLKAAKELRTLSSNFIKIIPKDLSKPTAAQEIYQEIKRDGINIEVLVNNAGFGTYGLFADSKLDEQQQMIEVNIQSLVSLTNLFLPDMIKSKKGKILNVASIAGFLPGPLMSVYYASKAFVLSFSKALSNELEGTGVTLSALCPGPTATQFQARAKVEKLTVFNRGVSSSKQVAKDGYEGLMKGERVIISGLTNKIQLFFIRFIPTGSLLKIVRKIQEM